MSDQQEHVMRLMRIEEVCDMAGIGKTSVYKLIGEGVFPKPVNVYGRTVRWVSDEIEAWILERVEERDAVDRETPNPDGQSQAQDNPSS